MRITSHLPQSGGYNPPKEEEEEEPGITPGGPYDTVTHHDEDNPVTESNDWIPESDEPDDVKSSVDIIEPSNMWSDSPKVFEKQTYSPEETVIQKGSKGIYYYSDDVDGNRTWYVAEQSPAGVTLLYYANEWGNANHSFGPAGMLVMNEDGHAAIHPMDDDKEFLSPDTFISNFWNELDQDEGYISDQESDAESESDFEYDDRSDEQIIDDFWSSLDEDEGDRKSVV